MDKKITDMRDTLLNTSLGAWALMVAPVLALSLARIWSMGWQPVFLLQMGAALATGLVYLLRRRLPFALRFGIYGGGWVVVTLIGAAQLGLPGAWPITLLVLPILATLFYDLKRGFLAAVGVGLAVLLIATLFHVGLAQGTVAPLLYLNRYAPWLLLLTVYSLTVLTLIYPLGKMQTLLLTTTQDLRAQSTALAASQTQLFQTLELLPVAIAISDMQGVILYINRTFRETLGYSMDDIPTADAWFQRAYPDPAYRESVTAVWQADVAAMMTAEHPIPARIYWVTTRAGVALEVEMSAQVAGDQIVVTFNNVTERRQAERRLAQERQLLRTVIDNLPDAVYAKDMQRRKILANLADLNNIGEPESAVLGKTDEDAYPSELAARFTRDDLSVLETGQAIHNREELLVNKEGRKRWLMTTKLPLRDETGQLIGLVGIGRDITEQRQAEAALRESAERFSSIIENTDAGYFFIDKDGIFRDVNPAWVKLYHYTWPEEVLGRHFTQVQQLEDPGQAQEIFESILHSDPRYTSGESRRKCIDGCVGYHTFSARPVFRGEELTGIEGFIIDTTEQKQTEAALRASEQRFRALFAAMTEGVALHEMLYTAAGVPTDYRIVDVNPAYVTHTGFSRQEVVGEKASNVHHTTPPPYFEIYKKVVMTGAPAHFETYFVPMRKHFSVSVFSPEKGQFAAIFEDITTQKRAEAERERLLAQIQESAQQLRQIMDAVPEGVLLLGVGGRILLTNPVADDYLALLAEYHSDAILAGLGDRPLAELLTSPVQGLWHEITRGMRYFEAIARPVEHDATPSGWVLVLREITQEREIQRNMQRQERLAVVGQLAAGIAHDFNNILAGIVLYSQMSLRTPDLPPRLHERLTVIEEQSQRAADLINQILDFSRRAVLDRRPLDLVPLVKEQVKLWQHTLPETIHITLTCAEDAYTVNADLTRMQQMLMNLVVNARDAMPDGGTLKITLAQIHIPHAKSAPLPDMPIGEWVRISVADTGMGIPDDVLARLFTPFFTTKAPGRGTGLGLAQVYGIVTAHEGRIEVKSQVDAGTIFDIYLPLLESPEVMPWEAADRDLLLGGGETVLVVEDNAATREALVESVELLHYRALAAENGAVALQLFAQQTDEIALVLSDMVMPEMGGKALAQALHQLAPTLPVIVMSGHPLAQESDTLQRAGVTTWLQKPPTLEQLAEALAQALGRGRR